LKIETKIQEDRIAKMTVELEPETLERFKHQAARKISEENRIPGFRPGKAPFGIVRRMFGDDLLSKKAIDILLDEVYPKALDEAELIPSGPGSLEEIISTDPPTFSFLVPLLPEVILCDYHKIHKDYQLDGVTDEDIDRIIKNLQTNFSTAEPVDRAIKTGDLVSLKLKGTILKPDEGQNAEFIKDSPHQVIVGGGSDIDSDNWPFDGFSKKLIRLKAGEEKIFTYTYPKDFSSEKIAGKKVEFNVTIQSIKILNLPEVNDAFAQTLGDYANVEALRSSIQTRLKENQKQEYDKKYFMEILGVMVQQSTIRYPANVLKDEMNELMEQLESDLAEQKMDLETYLKVKNIDHEKYLEDEIKPAAKKRLERALVLNEFGLAEKISITKEEIEKSTLTTMEELKQDPDFMKIQQGSKLKNIETTVTMNTANRILNQRLMAHLIEITSANIIQEPPKKKKSLKTIKVTDEAETIQQQDTPKMKKSRSTKKVEEPQNNQTG